MRTRTCHRARDPVNTRVVSGVRLLTEVNVPYDESTRFNDVCRSMSPRNSASAANLVWLPARGHAYVRLRRGRGSPSNRRNRSPWRATRVAVDLEAGSLARADVGAVDFEVDQRARHDPAQLVGVIRGPLRGVLLVPVDRFVEVARHPRRAEVQPEVAHRRDRQGKVLLRQLVGRVVEDVVVDPDIGDRDHRVHHQRADADADVVDVRAAIAFLGPRPGSAQERDRDQTRRNNKGIFAREVSQSITFRRGGVG